MVGAFLGFVAGVLWFGRVETKLKGLETAVTAIQNEKIVKTESCIERRGLCDKSNQIQFDHGTAQFTEIKELMAENARKNEEAQKEMFNLLREMHRHG